MALLSNQQKQPFPLAPLFSQASYCQLPPIKSFPAQIEPVAYIYFPGTDFKRPSLLGEVRERRQIEPKFVGDFSNVFNV